MTTDTVFDLASLTKPVATAASVLHLVQHGKLRLDDPVSKHLPAFGKDKVTLEHLLLHTSGLPAGNPVAAYTEGTQESDREDLRNCVSRPIPARSSPTPISVTSCWASWSRKLSRRIARRLRPQAPVRAARPVGANLPPRQEADGPLRPDAEGEGCMAARRRPRPARRALGGVAGHAGLFGTADDLAVFAQMLLDGGKLGKKRILDEATVKLFTTPLDVPGGKRTPGWDARHRLLTQPRRGVRRLRPHRLHGNVDLDRPAEQDGGRSC